jgi:hypothetical protein
MCGGATFPLILPFSMKPKDGVGKEKPALIPAFSPREKEKRLPRLGKMMAIDLRVFRGSMREFLRGNLSPKERTEVEKNTSPSRNYWIAKK